MHRFRFAFATLVAALPLRAQAPSASDPRAVAVIDQSLQAMGGESALRAIRTMRVDFMTAWLRTSFVDHPSADSPTYERHAALYDFVAKGWRNTRAYPPGGTSSIDIVIDTVGQRTLFTPVGAVSGIMPLNIAYVDDRREQFAFGPERTLLVAKDAGGLRLLTDTTIAGERTARVATTVDGFPATWFLRRADHLPVMVRFRANETNDFGLAPWDEQEVEIWWTAWTRVAPGVLLPRQRDTRRVGRPYRRMTVLAITLNAPAPADSFAIADSVRTRYLATEQRPMWKAPLDSSRVLDGRFAVVPPFTGSAGAVKVGGEWVLMETAQAGGAVDHIASWLKSQDPTAVVGAGIVARSTPSNGGAKWFTDHHRPLFVSAGAAPMLPHLVRSDRATRQAQIITASRWVRVGSDSLWLERLDLPDAVGSLLVYSPTLKWLYAPLYGSPAAQADFDAAIARLRARRLSVDWVGGPRGIRQPAPAPK